MKFCYLFSQQWILYTLYCLFRFCSTWDAAHNLDTLSVVTLQNLTLRGRISWLYLPLLLSVAVYLFIHVRTLPVYKSHN